MSELKTCPFCGGEARITYRSPTVYDDEFRAVWEIGCIKCPTKKSYESAYVLHPDTEVFITKTDGRKRAIDAWNRRAT